MFSRQNHKIIFYAKTAKSHFFSVSVFLSHENEHIYRKFLSLESEDITTNLQGNSLLNIYNYLTYTLQRIYNEFSLVKHA